MPIADQVDNLQVMEIIHLILLLQFEHVIDALCLGKKSLYFDFFTFRYIHITYKVLVLFLT